MDMDMNIKGRNVEITDWLRQHVEKKLGKLDRFLPNIQHITVELTTESTKSANDRHVAQVTLRSSNGAVLRAEERSADILSAIDTVVDKMYRQIDRFKGKHWRQGRGGSAPSVGEVLAEPMLDEEEEDEGPVIARRKRFAMSPMTEEEAIEQMEMLGHDFFIFFNPSTGSVNVVYKRRDGNYGLLQPELV